MAIYPIGPVTGGPGLNPAGLNPQVAPEKGVGNFVGMLQNALGQLNDLAQNADAVATQAASGEDVDLHQVMMAMQSATLGFDLGLQVRNKLVEAYQEIIRMQV